MGEKGFTLIELLASIVILGVIFLVIFQVLGQSITMSSSVSDQYVTTNLAEREMGELMDLSLGNGYEAAYNVESNGQEYLVEVRLYEGEPDEVGAGLLRVEVKVTNEDNGRYEVSHGFYRVGVSG